MLKLTKSKLKVLVFVSTISTFLCVYIPAEAQDLQGGDTASSEAGGHYEEGTESEQAVFHKRRMLDEGIRYLQASEVPERKLMPSMDLPYEKGANIFVDNYIAYNSNIYSSRDNTQDDYIFYLVPSAYFKYGNEFNSFTAFYDAEQLIYVRNHKETRLNQGVGAKLELFKGGRFEMTIKDIFRRTAAPATSETMQYIDRLPNERNCEFKYNISPKSAIGLKYKQNIRHYLSSSRKDFSYVKHVFAPMFFWNWSPKLTLIGEYDLGFINYYIGHPGYSSRSHQIRVGAKGSVTPSSVIFAKAGFHYREYYNEEIGTRTKLTGPHGAQWTPILEGIYRWTPFEKTAFEFIAAKRLTESVYKDFGFYNSTNMFVTARRELDPELEAIVTGYYIRNDYPRESKSQTEGIRRRQDSTYGFMTELDYKFDDWLTLYCKYEFRFRDSNFREFGYKVSIISSGAKVVF